MCVGGEGRAAGWGSEGAEKRERKDVTGEEGKRGLYLTSVQ